MKGLLKKDPEERLSAEDLLHHPWFIDMRNRRKTRPYQPKQTASSRFSVMEIDDQDDLEEEIRREQEEKARLKEMKRAMIQEKMRRQEYKLVVSPRDMSPRSREVEMKMVEKKEEEEVVVIEERKKEEEKVVEVKEEEGKKEEEKVVEVKEEGGKKEEEKVVEGKEEGEKEKGKDK